MLIKSLRLKNFRQFEDITLAFSTDPEKNVTVLVGGNTFGKTTLIRAFLWCLYKQNDFKDKNLLGNDIAKCMAPTQRKIVSVAISLEHGGFDFTIETHQEYAVDGSGKPFPSNQPITSVSKKDPKTGITTPLSNDNAAIEIERILPLALQPYFFFDGETNPIEDIGKRRNLEGAITQIMGLDKKEDLEGYFDSHRSDSVCSKFEVRRISTDDAESVALRAELERCQNDLQKVTEEANGKRANVDLLEDELRKKEAKIDLFKSVESQQNDLKNKFRILDQERSSREENFAALIEAINAGQCALGDFFGSVAYAKADIERSYSSTQANERSLSHIEVKAIDEIEGKGVCICGRHFRKGDDAWANLEAQKDFISPNDFGMNLKTLCGTMDQETISSRIFYKNVIRYSSTTVKAISDIEDVKSQIDQIEKDIEGKPDVGKLQAEARQIRNDIDTNKSAADYDEKERIPALNGQIDSLGNKIKKLSQDCEANQKIDYYLSYCKRIHDMLAISLASQRQEVRIALQKKVNEIFHSIFGPARNITIDPNFSVSSLVSDGSLSLDESNGLEAMKNFSFVGGLIYLAKNADKIGNGSDDLGLGEEGEIYPLVMDAPFSKCDGEPITKICSTLPSMCNQIIIIIMEKDYNAAKQALGGRTGKIYRIKKLSETSSEIKEDTADVR
jgi:DNA sulfur modification protein DndD